jgi:hypothetical protein
MTWQGKQAHEKQRKQQCRREREQKTNKRRHRSAMRIYSIHTGSNSKAIQKICKKIYKKARHE